jgi:hypothetical protein
MLTRNPTRLDVYGCSLQASMPTDGHALAEVKTSNITDIKHEKERRGT